jgi:hypothetical protein
VGWPPKQSIRKRKKQEQKEEKSKFCHAVFPAGLAFGELLASLGREWPYPSSRTFAHAVKHYREIFAPKMLRESTFSVADGHLKCHLEAEWNDIPVRSARDLGRPRCWGHEKKLERWQKEVP